MESRSIREYACGHWSKSIPISPIKAHVNFILCDSAISTILTWQIPELGKIVYIFQINLNIMWVIGTAIPPFCNPVSAINTVNGIVTVTILTNSLFTVACHRPIDMREKAYIRHINGKGLRGSFFKAVRYFQFHIVTTYIRGCRSTIQISLSVITRIEGKPCRQRKSGNSQSVVHIRIINEDSIIVVNAHTGVSSRGTAEGRSSIVRPHFNTHRCRIAKITGVTYPVFKAVVTTPVSIGVIRYYAV